MTDEILKRTILITGTSGALGNYLRTFYISKGYHVIGTVGKSAPRVNEVAISLESPETFKGLYELLEGRKPDAIIHNAAMLKKKGNRKAMFDANVTGTRNILNLSEKTGCRNFIQISTVGVYGIRSLGKNRDESTKPFDIEAYGISKRKAEEHVRKSGIPYTILRLPLIKYECDIFIRKMTEGGGPIFIRKGENKTVSAVTPEFVAKVCSYIIERGSLNDTFNCADSHTAWKNLVEDHCRHEGIDIMNTRKYSQFAVFGMGIVMGPIALFGQHTPGEKLKKIMREI
ncbi:MAG: NAD(P)-dependent oxidoreductase [Clostridia bacterium]|nr:NAD(P)-dependent oxidoreductase [Clostridia bacterium]MBN2882559.1 NAD(P)-dependent oxidoreductase [Clostridia bacterium]